MYPCKRFIHSPCNTFFPHFLHLTNLPPLPHSLHPSFTAMWTLLFAFILFLFFFVVSLVGPSSFLSDEDFFETSNPSLVLVVNRVITTLLHYFFKFFFRMTNSWNLASMRPNWQPWLLVMNDSLCGAEWPRMILRKSAKFVQNWKKILIRQILRNI